MALSELQKARTRFHLGYPNDQIKGPVTEIQQHLVLGNLNSQTELALIGDPSSVGDRYLFLGQDLCQQGSLLYKLELAYDRCGPDTVDDSLFVRSAGSVQLRSDELQARRALYQSLRKDLENLLDVELFGSCFSGPSYGY